jgi:hypothetical protein
MILLKTILKLGAKNVLYIVWYKVSMKSGFRRLFFPIQEPDHDLIYFSSVTPKIEPHKHDIALLEEADQLTKGVVRLFSRTSKVVGNPPEWMKNPFSGQTYPDFENHWSRLSDFEDKYGDIKTLWELSRFNWASLIARAYAVNGDEKYLTTLNMWISDWNEKNPVNQGPNWKCGQEASIRLFHLLNSSLILNNNSSPSVALTDMIYAHLSRISSNIRYAIAQDNNHGTSEATALYIGGYWLYQIDPKKYPKSKKYGFKGARILEERVLKLIDEDGAFSQHSTNYHRVLLDTLIYAEIWRSKLELEHFSPPFYKKVKKAIEWLTYFTDPVSGDTPNFGANDGSLLLNLHSCDYRDFRPTLQTASVLFNSLRLFQPGKWDEPCYWFQVELNNLPVKPIKKINRVFKDGYVYMTAGESWAMIRYPHFRFRPSHNDVMHIDLWHEGKNVLSDAGTFSYNQSGMIKKYNLKSVHYHNTVTFDCQEQMPEISRFLLGLWIRPDQISELEKIEGGYRWGGQYGIGSNYVHSRTISTGNSVWIVEDELKGDFNMATIGFNVPMDEFHVEKNIISLNWGRIITPLEGKIVAKTSKASLFYHEMHETLRIEIEVPKSGSYQTMIELYK